MLLTYDDLMEIYVEQIEFEEMQKMAEFDCEHEDAGDRI